ncbi:MAG TPA: Na+/H+ antiporter [Candidatus Limnocylindria bacterium]|nr:Na+/H+ antiporter [Candidatus Limnocylindria bacterium]
MHPSDTTIALAALLGLLTAIALFATLSRRLGVPYPMLMVVGGLAFGFIPAVPRLALPAEVVLLIFLPPILMSAAYFTSLRDLRANLAPISLLAVGLVVATTLAVGAVANALAPDIGWAAAFTLGAIVSPPDAVAATAIAQRLGLPRRLVVILEGESLVNDATALTAFGIAATAATAGTFALSDAAVELAWVAVVGTAIGVAAGAAVTWIESRIDDAPVEVLVSLIAPFAAYLPAEQLGASGVLAAVACGLVLGRWSPRVLTSSSRTLGVAVWQMMIFLINAAIFVLIGLQLPVVLAEAQRPIEQLVGVGAAVAVTAIVVRLAWVLVIGKVVGDLVTGSRQATWRSSFVVGWAGMRGAVSLALALSLAAEFPGRDVILFSTFAVILATLVGQGLTLPFLIRRLGVRPPAEDDREEHLARTAATEAALARLEELTEEYPDHLPLIDQLRERYRHRGEHLPSVGDEAADRELLEHQRIRQEVLESERGVLIDLRDRGIIADDVLHAIQREIDLEQLRTEA